MIDYRLDWVKIAPGDYAVEVGDEDYLDTFHFVNERDAHRFVKASGYAYKRTRTR